MFFTLAKCNFLIFKVFLRELRALHGKVIFAADSHIENFTKREHPPHLMDTYVKQVHAQIGLGVFAKRPFSKGEVILSGSGPILDHQTMYTVQIDWDKHMDIPKPLKFLNHSCNPNLGVQQCDETGISFIAIRDIDANEELTFDYGMTEYVHYPRLDSAQEFDLGCQCGAPNCRGRLGYYSEFTPATRQKYQGLVAAYLLTPTPPTH